VASAFVSRILSSGTVIKSWDRITKLVCAAGNLLYPIAMAPMLAMLSLVLVKARNDGFFVSFWPTTNTVVDKEIIAKTTAFINSGTPAGSFYFSHISRLGNGSHRKLEPGAVQVCGSAGRYIS
jgi:hypothetical protein